MATKMSLGSLEAGETVTMRECLEAHAPDGRKFDVKPLLLSIENILNRAFMSASQAHEEKMEEMTPEESFNSMLDAQSFMIDRISCELTNRSLGGADPHNTMVSLFSTLKSYSWDAKLVLTLAAFAMNCGEFWLLAQIYSSNQIAKSMAVLKQLPIILDHSGPLKSRFDALNKLIKAMLDVTRCIIELEELRHKYVNDEEAKTKEKKQEEEGHAIFSEATADNKFAVYWTIKSVVACSTQITSLTRMGHENRIPTTEAGELSLAQKLNDIYDNLKKQLDVCHKFIEEKKKIEAYQKLHNLFGTIHIDNMKILKALICSTDDQQPLVDGSNKKRVNIDVLRRQNVLLLISGLDISHDELSILEQIYNESRMYATSKMERQYCVVWIPIVDQPVNGTTKDLTQKQFETLQSTMPWYTLHHPSLIDGVVIRFIKEVWHFRNKPTLVVLDPQGRVVNPNAIHMMWIWGSFASPFTSVREEDLWKGETLRLELLVNGIDPIILTWIEQGKYIFLYGGDNIEWIRKFTTTARAVAKVARIPLEMIYVGTSSKREQIRKVIEIINVEKLSYLWQDLTMIWFFWTRLESMFLSKIQQVRTEDQDPIKEEINKLLSYDNVGGWALLSKGSVLVVNGHGTTVLRALLEYDLWKEHVPVKGFDVSFKDHHAKSVMALLTPDVA